MDAYDEPAALVDLVIDRLGFGTAERAALERQKARFLTGVTRPFVTEAQPKAGLPPFPEGPFRFVALDVETANNDRGSICQIGVACVRPDASIETWVTHVDPRTDHWTCSHIHGITQKTVTGAPTFAEVLPVLRPALDGLTVYQHSGFDRSAVRAACAAIGCDEPDWTWQDSVGVARRAWPELKGNGGHGLASLKAHLGLSFRHHDAGEDARAAAEIVLHAEGARIAPARRAVMDDDFDVIEEEDTGPPPR
ncbi:3'-5' exonuclease [Aestuariicoccus sp. KMU-90]|uniref:3'-5' exonuclease n=2 Tax=Thetidibacter halocola TaxID=2827239 RepID=A0A8J8B839_9RHOB|nr:3'-5' exonuclease [Thetidibacter halocola]